MIYELCYLVGESKEQNLPKIKEEVANIISQESGKWIEPQIEEKRKMAYKVGKEIRGIYVTQRFEISNQLEDGESANVDSLANINRKLNLFQDVARFIIIKAAELPELKPREERSGRSNEGRKPAYVKKEAAPAKAVKEERVKEEEKTEEKEELKEQEELVPAKEEKKKEKSIDEKIDEILNI